MREYINNSEEKRKQREEFFDKKISLLTRRFGRIFFRIKSDNFKDGVIYEDDSYALELNIYGLMEGRAIRKDIKYTEGMPYNRATKGLHQIVRQSWRELEKLFVDDLLKMLSFIMTIDENARTIGRVYQYDLDRGFGFLSTLNCYKVFFHITDIPEHFRESLKIGQLFRFRQIEEPKGVKSVDFDQNFIEFYKPIPIESFPGYVKDNNIPKQEDNDRVLKIYYRQIQDNYQTYVIRADNPFLPHLYKLLASKEELKNAILKCQNKNVPMIKLNF